MTFRLTGAQPVPQTSGDPRAVPQKGPRAPAQADPAAAASRDQVTLSSAGRTLARALEAGGYAAPGELILSPAKLRELVRPELSEGADPERARNLRNPDARGIPAEGLTRHAATILQGLPGTAEAPEGEALKSGTPPADTGSNQPNTEDDHGH
jgi:hypothetical protein